MWSLLGILLSAGWLAVAWLWFDSNIGLDNYSYMLLPEVVGQYVAGLLAPLILIWVLMGYLRGPRGLKRLREDLGVLHDELAERERREAARARGETQAPPLRRAPEAMAPVPPAPAAVAAPTLSVTPPGPTPVGPAPLVAEPDEPSLAMPAGQGSSVTSLAQEVARSLGRIGEGPAREAAAQDNEAAPMDDEFRLLVHRVGRDLNAICMDLSAVLCRKAGRDEALKAYNRGQKDAFHLLVRDYLSRHEPAEIIARLNQADAQSLLHSYAMKFAGLIDEAARRDPSGAQEEALRRGPMGQLYEEMQRHTQVTRNVARG